MRTKSKSRLSYPECLQVIEQFGVRVAQSIIGGEVTDSSHPCGDLYHAERNAFSEVKVSGISGGPIIPEEQLGRHYEDSDRCDREYVFVLYANRKWIRGKYVYLPIRMGKDEATLRRFLVRSIKVVYVVHVSVVWAVYEMHKRNGTVQEYMMQRGLKRYIKIPHADLRSMVTNIQTLSQFGLNPDQYILQQTHELARFRNFKIPVPVFRIMPRVEVDGDSFDVVALEDNSF